jgi:hypothetical protein
MPFYTPTIPAIEHRHRGPDSARTIVCLSCGDTMKHLRTLPRLGVRLEKLIFVCPSCKRGRYKGTHQHAAVRPPRMFRTSTSKIRDVPIA